MRPTDHSVKSLTAQDLLKAILFRQSFSRHELLRGVLGMDVLVETSVSQGVGLDDSRDPFQLCSFCDSVTPTLSRSGGSTLLHTEAAESITLALKGFFLGGGSSWVSLQCNAWEQRYGLEQASRTQHMVARATAALQGVLCVPRPPISSLNFQNKEKEVLAAENLKEGT